jgi:hypothetical protein
LKEKLRKKYGKTEGKFQFKGQMWENKDKKSALGVNICVSWKKKKYHFLRRRKLVLRKYANRSLQKYE